MSEHRRLSTGIDGFDPILDGGLIAERAYMLRGQPGTGKTIFGLQFLTAGTEVGERALCINFEESTDDLRSNAGSLGIDVSAVEFLDLSPDGDVFAKSRSYDIFAPDEVEGPNVSERITEAVDEYRPDRVFVDPVSQLRHFSSDEFQFRKEVASFITYLTNAGATVVFSTQPTSEGDDQDLQFLCDGAVELGDAAKGRTVEVTKLRGSSFERGQHTVRIREGGLIVYPQLIPGKYRRRFEPTSRSSGVEGIDSLLHGGIEPGAVTVISGPSGVGKTTTGTHFAKEAAQSGERSVVYLFEETRDTFTYRSESIGIPIREIEEAGTLSVKEVEPVSVSPDEFAADVRSEVEENDAQIVMLDGISGYRLSIRGEKNDLVSELHSLCRYLKNMGVTVILVDDVQNLTGGFEATSERISYLADNLLFLRYVEVEGELRKAMGVLKMRASSFDRTLREFEIGDGGIEFGEPLTDLEGVVAAPSGRAESRDDD